MSKDDIKSELNKLFPQLKKVTRMIEDAEDNWTNHFNRNDPDDMFLRNMFNRISDQLEKARRTIHTIKLPIIEEGTLKKNSSGRYEIRSGHYYTSGSEIEFLFKNSYDDEECWILSSVEHREDYYIVSHPKLEMAGLKVRVRERSFDW
jgi:hypothetical protein